MNTAASFVPETVMLILMALTVYMFYRSHKRIVYLDNKQGTDEERTTIGKAIERLIKLENPIEDEEESAQKVSSGVGNQQIARDSANEQE